MTPVTHRLRPRSFLTRTTPVRVRNDHVLMLGHTRTLLRAAAEAGVRRVVQLSVTNAASDSRFPYFRAKAAVETDLRASGLSHAVVRPTLVFGPGEVLVNNIAWLLRRVPLFVVPGDGRYAVQPVAA